MRFLGIAPWIRLASWPLRKRIIVGIARTWYCAAVCWLSSTLSLTIRRSSRPSAISCSAGATTRQGPHHGAQKSTSTGVSFSSTSAWKLLSLTSVMSAIWCLRKGSRRFKKYSESLPGNGSQQHWRDPGLQRRGEDEQRRGDRRRDQRGGEQLVPGAAAARERPGGQREEEREQLRQGVGRKRQQQHE